MSVVSHALPRTVKKSIAALGAVGVLAFVFVAERKHRRNPNAFGIGRSRHLDRLVKWALSGDIRC